MALAQAHKVKSELESLHPTVTVEIVVIKTSGDRGERDRLGAFVREIQEALLADQVDIALHCLKDLPTQRVDGLSLAAYLPREDARDTLISRGVALANLPAGAVVGTGSVRRTSQLAAIRPDLVYRPLVGNVDTRLRKLIEGEYDAILLAIAGLRRLGILDTWDQSDYRELRVHPLALDEMVPAPGQAILVLETRVDDPAARIAAALHHPATADAAIEERAFLQRFGGGCSVPVAAYAATEGEGFRLTGLVAQPDGQMVLRASTEATAARNGEIGRALAEHLGQQGAFSIVETVIQARDAEAQRVVTP